MKQIEVCLAANTETVEADWGSLTWNASGQLGNAAQLTVGQCRLKPGQANPRHCHPNCEEVLVVVEGRITHTVADEAEAVLEAGDTVSIPAGVFHQARNVGEGEAVLYIAFSSAHREVQSE